MTEVIVICESFSILNNNNNNVLKNINNILTEKGITLPSNVIDEHLFTNIENNMNNYFIDIEKLEEYKEWLDSGLSNRRSLSLSLMLIPKNLLFKLHAHPNIECIFVLKGSIHELRLKSDYIVKRDFDINDNEGPDITNYCGLCNESFEYRCTNEGSYIINEKGSIHKSFTKESDTILLVIWSGVHNNITNIPNNLNILNIEN